MSGVWDEEADYVVVGSGAGGATAAVDLARAGADVLILEEGGFVRRADFKPDLHSALAHLWRDFGGQVATGRSAFPVAQGCCVGGSTVINGAAMHRLPQAVWERWAEDPGIRSGVPWEALEEASESLEQDLQIGRNLEPWLPNLPMTAALDRLGWSHQAMARAAPGCQHRRRCVTGCPSGGKWSLERSFVPEALERGARLRSDCRVERVLFEGEVVQGVEARARGKTRRRRGSRIRVRARRAVLVAAGAVHSPVLLRRSGVRGRHLGRHFQCHMGTTVVARFPRPAAEIDGPSMGYELLELPGVKLNSIQPTPAEIALGNVPLVGRALVELLEHYDQVAVWNSSTRCQVEGAVYGRWLGLPQIRLTPGAADLERLRGAVKSLGRILFEAGASHVYPGVAGIPRTLTDPAELEGIDAAPLDARAYALNVSHLFGTCRMGSDPDAAVVDPAFRVHGRRRLYVVDASVFPSHIGSNPQQAIMALARHATRGILACS